MRPCNDKCIVPLQRNREKLNMTSKLCIVSVVNPASLNKVTDSTCSSLVYLYQWRSYEEHRRIWLKITQPVYWKLEASGRRRKRRRRQSWKAKNIKYSSESLSNANDEERHILKAEEKKKKESEENLAKSASEESRSEENNETKPEIEGWEGAAARKTSSGCRRKQSCMWEAVPSNWNPLSEIISNHMWYIDVLFREVREVLFYISSESVDFLGGRPWNSFVISGCSGAGIWSLLALSRCCAALPCCRYAVPAPVYHRAAARRALALAAYSLRSRIAPAVPAKNAGLWRGQLPATPPAAGSPRAGGCTAAAVAAKSLRTSPPAEGGFGWLISREGWPLKLPAVQWRRLCGVEKRTDYGWLCGLCRYCVYEG